MVRSLFAIAAVLGLSGAASAQCGISRAVGYGTCGAAAPSYAPSYQAAPVYQAQTVLLAPLYVVPSAPTVVLQQQVQYVPQVQQQIQYVPQMTAPVPIVQQQIVQRSVVRHVPTTGAAVQSGRVQQAPVGGGNTIIQRGLFNRAR